MIKTYVSVRQEQVLCCPRCGDQYLRNLPAEQLNNDLCIPVVCECCGDISTMVLRRHKGQLFMQWRNGAPVVLEDA